MALSSPAVSADTSDQRVGDVEAFALAWYGQALRGLCRPWDLVPLAGSPDVPPWMTRLPGASSGHLVASTRGLLGPTAPAEGVVVGGPCIGDCTQGPTLEALYDTAQAVLAARALGATAVLYVGDREEALQRGSEGPWRKLGERIAPWLVGIAEALRWSRVVIVRTSSAAHEEALGQARDATAGVDPTRLAAAFHLGAGQPWPQDDRDRAVTRRVIDAHLPRVVARHAGTGALPHVVVAENLQQAGAVTLARELVSAGGERLDLLVHWPAPGWSAAARMYRSGRWDKVPAWDLERLARGEHDGAHPLTAQFFACWLTQEERAALADAARAWIA